MQTPQITNDIIAEVHGINAPAITPITGAPLDMPAKVQGVLAATGEVPVVGFARAFGREAFDTLAALVAMSRVGFDPETATVYQI